MKTCSECGNALEPDARFCGSCGNRVPEPVDLSSLPPPSEPQGTDTTTSPPQPAVGRSWRRFVTLALAGAALLVVVVVGGLVLLSGTGSVSVVGGGTARMITDSGDRPLPALPAEEPDEAWSDDLPGEAFLDAGVRGSTLYVLTSDLAGEYDDQLDDLVLTAFDTTSGDERWDLDLDGDSGVVVVDAGADDLVLQGTSQFGEVTDFTVTMVTTSGEERWVEQLDDERVSVSALPGDLLLLDRWSSSDREVRLLDAQSGDERFEERGSLMGAEGDRHLLRTDDDEIAVVDGNGDELWEADTDDHADAAIRDGLVYLHDGDELVAFDAASGDERWAVDIDNEEHAAVRPIPGVGVQTSGSEGTEVFDLAGEPLWDNNDSSAGSLVDRDGRLVLVRTEGPPGEEIDAEVLDARTGDELAGDRLDEATVVYNFESRTIGDVVTADHLVVRNEEEVRVLDYDDDLQERWAVDADGDFATGGVAIPGGIVVFGYEDDEHTMVAYH